MKTSTNIKNYSYNKLDDAPWCFAKTMFHSTAIGFIDIFSLLITSSLHPFQQPLKKQKQSEDDLDSGIESHFSQSVLTNYKQKAYTLTQTHEIHADVCEKQPKETTNEVIFELSIVV